ncbi:uncharacterized protein EV420DRAFT_1634233 [Desarmillaria tabescens]|uniref:DUF6593 domain-containing protein n=1 Tax=Armillaria tabescens TaxID=1929756 RepID=A0AA39U8S9_ARMTA|nr:uncharacterized protein EV420DRAFT_1634233 [Desarmillaria tabescens]KAK0469815.1 hypothetical protein EV420DRAFT_1634233 [Desarmillaria tabescens]
MSVRSQSIDNSFETSRPALSLIFQPDDPTRTDIIDGNTGQLYYSVDTIEQRKHQLTLVRRAASPIDSPSTVGEETTVASFEWHRYRPDMVSFVDNIPIPVTSWLKRSLNPFNTTVSFKDQTWKAYQWKGNSAGLSLTLYSGNIASPVAKFHKQHPPSSSLPRGSPASLVIYDRDIASSTRLDHLVASFLYLEKKRRGKEEGELYHNVHPQDNGDGMALSLLGRTSTQYE